MLPGYAAFISFEKEILFDSVEGYADIEKCIPITRDTKFRIGSITKTFTCTVLLQLLDEGVINSLEDYAYYYLSYLPKHVKLIELGNMTSGIYDYAEDREILDSIEYTPNREFTMEELLEIGLSKKIENKNWNYSNTGIIALGLIIEKLTKKSLNANFQERIFSILNMQNTSYLTEPTARGYSKTLVDVTEINPTIFSCASGIVSTLYDLKIYSKALATRQLLGPKARIALEESFVGDYGFGILREHTYFGHRGDIPGFQSHMLYSPKYASTIIILSNYLDTDKKISVSSKIAKLLHDINQIYS